MAASTSSHMAQGEMEHQMEHQDIGENNLSDDSQSSKVSARGDDVVQVQPRCFAVGGPSFLSVWRDGKISSSLDNLQTGKEDLAKLKKRLKLARREIIELAGTLALLHDELTDMSKEHSEAINRLGDQLETLGY